MINTLGEKCRKAQSEKPSLAVSSWMSSWVPASLELCGLQLRGKGAKAEVDGQQKTGRTLVFEDVDSTWNPVTRAIPKDQTPHLPILSKNYWVHF